jgi:hypothetical protein
MDNRVICSKWRTCKNMLYDDGDCLHGNRHEHEDGCDAVEAHCGTHCRPLKNRKPRNKPTGPAQDSAGMQPAAFAPDCLPSDVRRAGQSASNRSPKGARQRKHK